MQNRRISEKKEERREEKWNWCSRTFSAWAAIKCEFIVSTGLCQLYMAAQQKWQHFHSHTKREGRSFTAKWECSFFLFISFDGLYSWIMFTKYTQTLAGLFIVIKLSFSLTLCRASVSFYNWRICVFFWDKCSAKNALENYHKYLICSSKYWTHAHKHYIHSTF